MTGETIGAALRRTRTALAAAGIEDAAHEARRLLEHATGLARAALIARTSDPLTGSAAAKLDAAILDRRARRPLQHVEGWVEFYGLALACDARALIPRPDSECVAGAALARLPDDFSGRVADLGTGSGCLLLAILAHRPRATGLGLDASPDAAALARQNVHKTGLGDRATIETRTWSDWTGWADAGLIVSNPPYIRSDEIARLAPEVREHDPHAALDGGADGLDCYREIAALASEKMRPGTWLVLEIGHDQGAAVPDLLAAHGFLQIEVLRDLGGQTRVVCALSPARATRL